MKVLYPIGAFYPSQVGGPANSIYWLTKALVANGVNATVVTTDDGISSTHQFDKWVTIDGIKVIYKKENFKRLRFGMLFESLKQVRKHQIIQLTGLFDFPLIWIAIWSVFLDKKVIWSIRGELDPQALIYNKSQKALWLWLIKILPKTKISFHATCDAETTHIQNSFGEEVDIIQIPNFLEMPLLYESKSHEYLLYLGRIHPVKALENLIKAMVVSKVFRNSEMVLKIVGEERGGDAYSNKLKNLIIDNGLASKVFFLGKLEGIEKQNIYANAKVLILPSHTENFGNVVIESLAQGTPVIASKGTPWQLLKEEGIGYWVDNSPETLAESIDQMLQLSNETYSDMRTKSRKVVREKFDISENINKWVLRFK
jgi:glycosyltransferase involved in cell wall biosynthesis